MSQDNGVKSVPDGIDTNGRPYLRVDQAAGGVTIEFDGGFDCVEQGDRARLEEGDDGLAFRCDHGEHSLEGQIDATGTYYAGVYLVGEAA